MSSMEDPLRPEITLPQHNIILSYAVVSNVNILASFFVPRRPACRLPMMLSTIQSNSTIVVRGCAKKKTKKHCIHHSKISYLSAEE